MIAASLAALMKYFSSGKSSKLLMTSACPKTQINLCLENIGQQEVLPVTLFTLCPVEVQRPIDLSAEAVAIWPLHNCLTHQTAAWWPVKVINEFFVDADRFQYFAVLSQEELKNEFDSWPFDNEQTEVGK